MTQRAADLGMKALAVTDHGAMYGTIEFYSAAKAAGIKPIIGIEQYIATRGMHLKEGKADSDYYHMVLLANNDTHYSVPEQHDAHDLLLCIGTATNVDTPGRLKFETNEFFLKSPAG